VAATTKRRFGFSLGTRIFLMTALLIAAAVGAAVAVTAVLGDGIARRALRDQLASSHALQISSQDQRYRLLKGISSTVTFDPGFYSILAELGSGGTEALNTMLDHLAERQGELGFDFAMVLDPAGRALVRTDQPTVTGQDLSRRPLVAAALRENEAAGVWQDETRLYHAVAVPIIQAYVLQGYLVTGFALDDSQALELKLTSGADVAYLAATPAGPVVAASTLGAAAPRLLAALRAQPATLRQAMEQGEAVDQLALRLDGRPWVALLSPLRDAAGQPVGLAVSLASLDEALASYRRIESVLIVVGAVSLVLALALSYALSRRALRPVRQLVAATEGARRGNYDQRIGSERADEVGELARAFDVLLSDLREKRDMEAYVAELSRNLPEAPAGEALREPAAHKVTLLGLELRGYASRKSAGQPGATLDRLSRDLRRIATEVGSQKGRIEGVFGHRVLASFEGDSRSFRALRAAAEVLSALGGDGGLDAGDPPSVALAAGDAVVGSVVWEDRPQPAVVGQPVQRLESLLREATPGDLLLAPEVHDELKSAFAGAGVELSPQRGVVSTQPLYVLRGEIAARITGAESEAATLLAKGPAGDDHPTLAGIAPGQLLGDRFQVLSVLGAGGMGVVYKARDRELDDLVALKMLKRDVAEDDGLLDRLKSELKLARKITHPNVLRTFDFGEVDGIPYISMEYVRGVTLRYLLDREGRLPYSAGLRLAKQLCAGLGAAHQGGVIHRDIKPENLIIDHAGNAKLMDFGIARPAKRVTPGQTQAGWVVGTPQYLSPEQLEGKEPDQRADIYACGVVFYEVFTGQLPFSGETPVQVALKHLNEAPPPPRGFWAEMPLELEALILRCLEKDRDRRYPDVQSLAGELERLTA
jgi:eukaryotic-like serine/threonine-protein kinase